jgi:hypothetical protein
LDISSPIYPGPDNKTDIVQPICPFINGYIGFNYIGTVIVEPIFPFINGHIGSPKKLKVLFHFMPVTGMSILVTSVGPRSLSVFSTLRTDTKIS